MGLRVNPETLECCNSYWRASNGECYARKEPVQIFRLSNSHSNNGNPIVRFVCLHCSYEVTMGTETDALFRWTDEQRCKKGNFVRTLIGTSVNEENILSLISKYYLGGTYRLTNKRQDGDRKADIFDIVDSQEKKQLYHYVELPRSLKNRYMFIRGVPESEKAK